MSSTKSINYPKVGTILYSVMNDNWTLTRESDLGIIQTQNVLLFGYYPDSKCIKACSWSEVKWLWGRFTLWTFWCNIDSGAECLSLTGKQISSCCGPFSLPQVSKFCLQKKLLLTSAFVSYVYAIGWGFTLRATLITVMNSDKVKTPSLEIVPRLKVKLNWRRFRADDHGENLAETERNCL